MATGGSSVLAAPRAPGLSDPAGTASEISAPEAYRRSMELMWNYDLDSARGLLEPRRRTCAFHAGAYAECCALRVVLTGQRSEAAAALELVQAAELLGEERRGGPDGAARQVLSAELLLLRSGLQVLLGARFRAAFNLRQCWCTYRRLEHLLAAPDGREAATPGGIAGAAAAGAGGRDAEAAATAAGRSFCEEASEAGAFLSAADLRGRLCFGLGFFYLATSLLPLGLSQLARLAGFATHRSRGKAYLAECAECGLGPRTAPAAIVLAAYHLDIEPDVRRAGELLVASLGQRPENVLLHWAGSLLAWRNACIAQAVEMTGKALWCCGEELGGRAVYLQYELGTLRFMTMDWPEARQHLRFVLESARSGQVLVPYRTVVASQVAAAAFSMGLDEEGEAACRECIALQEPGSTSRLEGDFAEVLQLFLRQRVPGRRLLAFEVLYLLRQLPRLPVPTLQEMEARLAAWPAAEGGGPAAVDVEHCGAQVLRCVVLFYIGDVEESSALAPELARLCGRLPRWCAYLAAHGLYWCGRTLALAGRRADALCCLRQARAHRRYPFNISSKITKVLEELEASGA